MKQVRRATFETNSSSTHAICIPTKDIKTSDELYESAYDGNPNACTCHISPWDYENYGNEYKEVSGCEYFWVAVTNYFYNNKEKFDEIRRYVMECAKEYAETNEEFEFCRVPKMNELFKPNKKGDYEDYVEICQEYPDTFKLEEYKNYRPRYCIEHSDQLAEFFSYILNPEHKLELINFLRYGKVFTGYDNVYEFEQPGAFADRPVIEVWGKNKKGKHVKFGKYKNPHYDPDNYIVIRKDN